jgi:hypothetical protein
VDIGKATGNTRGERYFDARDSRRQLHHFSLAAVVIQNGRH